MAPRISPHTPLSEAQLELVAERFRALAVPSRLRVLNALMGGALGMSELAEATGLQQSNLSRQVTELERAGCVARVRDGREVTVQIADPKPITEGAPGLYGYVTGIPPQGGAGTEILYANVKITPNGK